MSDVAVLASGPAYCAITGRNRKDFVPIHVYRCGQKSDWISRADFLSVRTGFNKCLRGQGNAEGPWKGALPKLFDLAATPEMMTWLSTRPYSLEFIWTSENDKQGYLVPRFDAIAVRFSDEAAALMFKLTLGGSLPAS